MPVRLRKFIGTILIVVLVAPCMRWWPTRSPSRRSGNAPWWGHLLYFSAHRPCLGPAGDADHQMDGRSAAAVKRVAIFANSLVAL